MSSACWWALTRQLGLCRGILTQRLGNHSWSLRWSWYYWCLVLGAVAACPLDPAREVNHATCQCAAASEADSVCSCQTHKGKVCHTWTWKCVSVVHEQNAQTGLGIKFCLQPLINVTRLCKMTMTALGSKLVFVSCAMGSVLVSFLVQDDYDCSGIKVGFCQLCYVLWS